MKKINSRFINDNMDYSNDKSYLLKNAIDLLKEYTYGIVNGKKEIVSITYSSLLLDLTVTETFGYDSENDIISIQLS